MNEIVKIYKDNRVRIIPQDGEPWFVAKDVCDALKIARHQNATRYLDDDEKRGCLINTPSGEQEMTVVSEAGLYSLILRSRKPEAKTFKRWVTHEVLPSIRKTGSYLAPDLDLKQIASITKQIVELAKRLLAENAELHEKVAFMEQFIPKGNLGDPSAINGKPKWQQRSGCYVSNHGCRPKRLNPEKCGYLQLDLFRDFVPTMLLTNAINIININSNKLLENN